MNLAQLAYEIQDIAPGQVSQETEYVFYARLENPQILVNAIHHEAHVQAQVVLQAPDGDKSSRLRIRRTRTYVTATSDEWNEQVYVQTLKLDRRSSSGGIKASTEISDPVSAQMFMALLPAAKTCMVKHRYVLPVQGRSYHWEIDRFVLQSGEFSPWCKIDIEVPAGTLVSDIPELPAGFHLSSAIRNQRDQQTSQEGSFISSLYKDLFTTPCDDRLMAYVRAGAQGT
jgi:hypothetical protein